jgi:hypothetical protein
MRRRFSPCEPASSGQSKKSGRMIGVPVLDAVSYCSITDGHNTTKISIEINDGEVSSYVCPEPVLTGVFCLENKVEKTNEKTEPTADAFCVSHRRDAAAHACA